MKELQPSPANDDADLVEAAEAIVQALVDAGVTHVFGGHGAAVVPIICAIVKHPNIEWVLMRNETNASLAAAAYGKLTGSLGVCLATSGPGAAYLTCGLIDALQDFVPVLALTGLIATQGIGGSNFQDIRQAQLFAGGGIKWSKACMSSESVLPLLHNAMHFASDNSTVAHLAIPVDIQLRKVLRPPSAPSLFEPPGSIFAPSFLRRSAGFGATQSRLDSCARLLAIASATKRIVIGVGHRAALVNAGDDILSLAECLNAPVVTSLDGKGAVDESHRLSIGVSGIFGNPGMEASNLYLSTADVVILFGIDMAHDMVLGVDGYQRRVLIDIDSVPNALPDHYNVAFMLHGDVSDVARSLVERIEHVRMAEKIEVHLFQPVPSLPVSSSWRFIRSGAWRYALDEPVNVNQSTRSRANATPFRFSIDTIEPSGYCHPGRVLKALGHRMQKEDVLAVDTGDITLWTSLCVCLTRNQRMLASQNLGTMGYGVNAAIAASCCRPKSKVIAVLGDGGAQPRGDRVRRTLCSSMLARLVGFRIRGYQGSALLCREGHQRVRSTDDCRPLFLL